MWWLVRMASGAAVQKCYDPDCRAGGNGWEELPEEVRIQPEVLLDRLDKS